jgi:hypothetical protein
MDMSQSWCLHEPLSPAVQRCCEARNAVFIRNVKIAQPDLDPDASINTTQLAAILKNAGILYETQSIASAAYRYAMPDPGTRQGIKDYIACILHGMTVEAISKRDGAALLAGARIALAAHRSRKGKGAEKANTSGHPKIPAQPAA